MIQSPNTIVFDNKVFSLDTIKGALYKFADNCSFDISCSNEIITVTIHSVDENKNLIARIRNEVIDQDLRSIIAKETSNVRTLILANAFSNTGLIES